jgi:hypothetical protein
MIDKLLWQDGVLLFYTFFVFTDASTYHIDAETFYLL